jgi:GntR family transcriptional repressor for pyruvate dehydrogenase complex
MSDKIEKPIRLPQKIAQILTQRIRDGELSPSENLPTEKKLSEMFDVSRSVVREAISILKYDGLVDTKQGVGCFVSKQPNMGSFRISKESLKKKERLRSLFELRMYVESAAAELASANRDDSHLKIMSDSLDIIKSEIDAGRPASENGIAADMMFHQALSDATKNYYFHQMVQFLNENLRITIEAGRINSSKVERMPEKVHQEHLKIYEAVRGRDVISANKAMKNHILASAARLGLVIGTDSISRPGLVSDMIS